ncbi:hypothetical protein [Microbacterium sp. W4I20]|uniref:hypothetical protein n=1 Tax=Microbacterium sp. W4I20 TaxID=3042262 RepID=UPI002785B603|nr:hypothetical protein [Microbacterium sp. W4I20]MDQ0729156.1 hypothetical protein [Microbacterium sp. W4I20]
MRDAYPAVLIRRPLTAFGFRRVMPKSLLLVALFALVVVITREARDASGEVHDWVPAFRAPDTWVAWLAPEKLTGDRKAETWQRSSTPQATSPLRSASTSSTARSATRTVDPTDPILLEPVA